MNVAKWLILAVLALPLAEVAVFVAVAATIGFGWALILVLGASLTGALVLRHAGGNHIARMRVAMAEGSFTSLRTDSTGGLILLAGFLLLVPGFITDAAGLLLLLKPLRQWFAETFGGGRPAARADGVIDLEPEQWHRVPDAALSDRREDERPR